MLRKIKKKSKKFRIQWSKVPRVLEPLSSSYGHFSRPASHGRFKPKNTQNSNKSQFPGANVHFQQMLRETKTKSKKFRIRWSKVPRVSEPLNRVMAFLVTRLATAVSSRKTPKMAMNRNFPGLRAFSANVATNKTQEQEIQHPMIKSTARFGAPKFELWPF